MTRILSKWGMKQKWSEWFPEHVGISDALKKTHIPHAFTCASFPSLSWSRALWHKKKGDHLKNTRSAVCSGTVNICDRWKNRMRKRLCSQFTRSNISSRLWKKGTWTVVLGRMLRSPLSTCYFMYDIQALSEIHRLEVSFISKLSPLGQCPLVSPLKSVGRSQGTLHVHPADYMLLVLVHLLKCIC